MYGISAGRLLTGGDNNVVVGPSADTAAQWYGGAVPENIVVTNPVIIVSRDGAADTTINISTQSSLLAVVQINSSGVIIDGFTITSSGPNGGASTGVAAFPTSPDLEHVKVLNNRIKIDQYTEGIGIDMGGNPDQR